MSRLTLIAGIVLMMVATQITRFFPFLVFRGNGRYGGALSYLSRALPPAMLTLLIVYCLRGVNVGSAPYGLPELLGVLTAAGLHLWKRNALLSIFASTALYMALVQLVF